ncbi:hypothetical protein EV356DRAFT_500778 [Viridothelium virens]|uniref:Uncharacterized protein n=1 Tax=Viridothelium virens TaxID=1048519 RepID=A0A6A6HAW9_VIRVR|nr:hypothetical protein EV356DRAFT_500778 [Viridothelium virens]
MIAIYWKAGDRPSTSTLISTGKRTSAFTIPSSTLESLSATSSKHPRSNFSVGTLAAVGIVPALAIVTAASFMGLLIHRRKIRSSKKKRDGKYRKPELDALDTTKNFVDGGQPVELFAVDGARELGVGTPHELEAPNTVHELQDSRYASAGRLRDT